MKILIISSCSKNKTIKNNNLNCKKITNVPDLNQYVKNNPKISCKASLIYKGKQN